MGPGLYLRLTKGSDRLERARLVLGSLGIAFAVLVVLVCSAVPRAMEDRENVLRARLPVASEATTDASAAGGLRVVTAVERRPEGEATLVQVAGVSPASPTPPGVRAWPAVGESVVSSAVGALRPDDPLRRDLDIVGTITQAGLTEPGELLVYTVTAELPQATPVQGFGNRDAEVVEGTPTRLVAAEVALFAGVPALLFVATVLRLLALARRERSEALRLVGVSPLQTWALAAVELAVLIGVGAAVGSAVHAATQAWLGASGLLGLRWFPRAGELPLRLVIGVCACLWAGGLLLLGPRRPAERSRAARLQRRRGAPVVALLVYASALAGVVVVHVLAPDRAYSSTVEAGVALSTVGAAFLVPLAASSLTQHAAARRSTRARSLAARLGAAQTRDGIGHVALPVGTLATATFLAAAAGAALVAMKVAALGSLGVATATVDLSPALPPEARSSLASVEASRVVRTHSQDSQGRRLPVVVGDCADLAALGSDSATSCQDVVSAPTMFSPPFTVTLRDGAAATVSSASPAASSSMPVVRIPRDDAPWALSVQEGTVVFGASTLDGSFDELVHDLRAAAPGTRVDAGVPDPDAWARYQQHQALFRVIASLGLALALGGLLASLVEHRRAQRRSASMLAAIGAPASFLRRVTISALVLATLVTTVFAGLLGGLAGVAYLLAVEGLDTVRLALRGLVLWSTLPALGATTLTAALAAALPPARVEETELHGAEPALA